MKLFQTFQKLLPILVGYDKLSKYDLNPSCPNQNYLFYFTSRFANFVFLTSIIDSACCLIFVASTVQEYTDNVVLFAAAANDTFGFIMLRLRLDKMFDLGIRCEKMIKERKKVSETKYVCMVKN